MKDTFDLLGRFFLSFIFLTRVGVMLYDFDGAVQELVEAGWSWKPEFSLGFACFLMILGGLMVLLGYRSSFGAFLLAVFTLLTTIYFYDFWNAIPEEKFDKLSEFMKNISILGGLFIVMAHGSGKYSIKRLFASTTA